jgi:hypothetical protein
MRARILTLVMICAFPLFRSGISAQSPSRYLAEPVETASEEKEPAAIVGIGAAMGWNTAGGAAVYAPYISGEKVIIRRWLEVEAGTARFFTPDSAEWDTDLLFKKPWTISRRAEFMIGVGPEWVRVRQDGKTISSVAGEVAADLMFWPGYRHRVGWFFEPVFDYSFAGGHAKTVGMSAGLVIAIR